MKIDKAPSVKARSSSIEQEMIPPNKCYFVIFLAILQLICYFGIIFTFQKHEPIMTTVTTLLQGKDTRDKFNPYALT